MFWRDVPKPSVNGILLGFHVVCERLNSSERHFIDLVPGVRNWEFKELEKFTNYSCWLRAYNNFGNGTWSKELVISTDEDGRLIEGKINDFNDSKKTNSIEQIGTDNS